MTCGSTSNQTHKSSSILPVRACKSRFFGMSSAGFVLFVCIPTLMAALQLTTHSHSHFRPLTSPFLCIPTLSCCIACWKPQPSFFSFSNTSLAIFLLHRASFYLSTCLSCSPTCISALSPRCLHKCVRLYTVTSTCFASQTKSLFR